MCHQGHLSDANPLVQVGDKDITAHVNFSAMALTAQDAGMQVLGYTTQAHALINCGLLDLLHGAAPRSLAAAQTLLAEHEMGELFKVLGLARGVNFDAIAFCQGDRSHTL
jgi:SAM-dependent MidA family methyltransferase